MRKQVVYQVTVAHALRDVLIKVMDEAMLAPFVVILWGTIVLYKMPAYAMVALVHEMLNIISSGQSIGWVVALIFLIMWGGQVHLIQRRHRRELDDVQRRAVAAYNRKLRKSKVKV
ncbi:hypothetical protein [Vibrio sp. TBV020]|uniref:hypothetical protein n=1 Tax=Vibrio sp. TBV020 TaxID=3137398 RepID=UPI0038CD9BD8